MGGFRRKREGQGNLTNYRAAAGAGSVAAGRGAALARAAAGVARASILLPPGGRPAVAPTWRGRPATPLWTVFGVKRCTWSQELAAGGSGERVQKTIPNSG